MRQCIFFLLYSQCTTGTPLFIGHRKGSRIREGCGTPWTSNKGDVSEGTQIPHSFRVNRIFRSLGRQEAVVVGSLKEIRVSKKEDGNGDERYIAKLCRNMGNYMLCENV
jgi:hypothetical protein